MPQFDSLTDALLSPLGLFWSKVVAFTPNLLAAAILVAVGYVLARAVRFLIERVLAKVGLNRLGDSIGVSALLANVSENLTLSRMLGVLAFWFVFLAFFISAADALGLPGFARAIEELAAYVPHVVGGIVVLLVGLYVARIAREAVTSGMQNVGGEYASVLGRVVFLLIVIVTASLVVNLLNIETTLLNQVVVVVLIGAISAAALALGLGGRPVAGNIMAGIYLREIIRPEQRIALDDVAGRLVAITAVKTIVETEDGKRVNIANRRLLDVTIVVEEES